MFCVSTRSPDLLAKASSTWACRRLPSVPGSRARQGSQKVNRKNPSILAGTASTAKSRFRVLFRQGVSTLKSERAHFLRSLSLLAAGCEREHEAWRENTIETAEKSGHSRSKRTTRTRTARSIDRSRESERPPSDLLDRGNHGVGTERVGDRG